MTTAAVIGKRIASLRDEAGLKQNELAKKLEWSAAVLSRVESGDRPLSDDELDIILDGIGTAEARKVKTLLARRWEILPVPDLADPDADLLWDAEKTAQKVLALAERPDVKQIFERRLVRYETELSGAAQRVMNKRYRIVFTGTIGAGKSTAICRVEGLQTTTAKGAPKPVLETGAGGITICEVHLSKGPGYGLIVQPCTDDEVRRHVTDFANFLMNPSQPGQTSDEGESGSGSPGISREVERAIRSMANLRRKRADKKPDGTITPAVDEARELAKSMVDARALSVEILARMELHKRDRRDIWFAEASGKDHLEWLQDTFERINNGRHPDFTLPKRIELVIPTAVLADDSVAVTLIDTQGIDDIAGRADLEQHFDDPHTVVVLCTVFNEAPATSVQQLLTRAKDAGVRTLHNNAAILALPRPGEALAMKDNGIGVDNAIEGYQLKGDEVDLKLHSLGLPGLPVTFFNASEDDPEELRSFLLNRLGVVREFHRKTLREIIRGAKDLLANYEKAQARETMEEAARHLTVWLNGNASLDTKSAGHVQDSLLSAVQIAHSSTVYAAVVRSGDWHNLAYGHQLSHGARRMATRVLEPKLEGFRTIATNLLDDGELTEAHDLIRQAVRYLEDGFDSVIRKAQLVGQSIHADEMSSDSAFWDGCRQEWGQGGGYRNRINSHNRQWFESEGSGNADARVLDLVEETWSEAVEAVRKLLGESAPVEAPLSIH